VSGGAGYGRSRLGHSRAAMMFVEWPASSRAEGSTKVTA
jgi:hypothetical protein